VNYFDKMVLLRDVRAKIYGLVGLTEDNREVVLSNFPEILCVVRELAFGMTKGMPEPKDVSIEEKTDLKAQLLEIARIDVHNYYCVGGMINVGNTLAIPYEVYEKDC